MENIKFYKLQKIIMFIPMVNLFSFFIWGINMICLRGKIKYTRQLVLAFFTFVSAYISWRVLSMAWTVATYYVSSGVIIDIITGVYYYLLGIVLTIVWLFSEKKLNDFTQGA